MTKITFDFTELPTKAERDMPEQFFCAGCGEEISGEFCDDDGHGLCRSCDREQQMESAADQRADR